MKLYENHYAQLNFERAELFKAVREKYPCRDVLYPGCSIHITPSLYFPHVVYVDQSETAAQFFAHERSILEFVSRNKRYRQSAYLRFIPQDYSRSLPLLEGTFELLLALFAGGIANSCARYLKPGGLLLTNNHQGEAREAVDSGNFTLLARITLQRGKYTIAEEGLRGSTIPAQKRNSNYLRQANRGIEYVEHEVYYVLRITSSEGETRQVHLL